MSTQSWPTHATHHGVHMATMERHDIPVLLHPSASVTSYQPSALSPFPDEQICLFDLECLAPRQGRALVEFGCILVDRTGWYETGCYSTLINPNVDGASKRSTDANGITESMLQHAPTFRDVALSIFRLMDGRIWCGHNIKAFDIGILRNAFDEIGVTPPRAIAVLDTLHIARQQLRAVEDLNLSSAALSTLTFHFGLGEERHRAISDCRHTLEVLRGVALSTLMQKEIHKERNRSTVERKENKTDDGPPPSHVGVANQPMEEDFADDDDEYQDARAQAVAPRRSPSLPSSMEAQHCAQLRPGGFVVLRTQSQLFEEYTLHRLLHVQSDSAIVEEYEPDSASDSPAHTSQPVPWNDVFLPILPDKSLLKSNGASLFALWQEGDLYTSVYYECTIKNAPGRPRSNGRNVEFSGSTGKQFVPFYTKLQDDLLPAIMLVSWRETTVHAFLTTLHAVASRMLHILSTHACLSASVLLASARHCNHGSSSYGVELNTARDA